MVWCVNCNHFKIFISHVRFASFRFCLLCIKLVSVGLCLWGSQLHVPIQSFWSLQAACSTAWHSQGKVKNEDFRVFECKSEDRVEDLKELDESKAGNGGTATRKRQSNRSDLKWTPNFVGKIRAMIIKKPSQSIWPIAWDVWVSKFLIRLRVYEDIRYFLFKVKKDKFLSQSMKDERKHHSSKLLNKLKHHLPTNTFVFLKGGNFCQDQMVNLQNNRCLPLSP